MHWYSLGAVGTCGGHTGREVDSACPLGEAEKASQEGMGKLERQEEGHR